MASPKEDVALLQIAVSVAIGSSAICLQWSTGRALSADAPTAKLRAVTEIFVFLVGLFLVAAGGVLGAFLEVARARSGYLAKQYHDLLVLLFALEHSAADVRPASQLEEEAEEEAEQRRVVSELKEQRRIVLEGRSSIEAAVLLFGEPKVAEEVRALYADIAKADTVPDQFHDRIEKLARAFRGSWRSRLSPQRRWFR